MSKALGSLLLVALLPSAAVATRQGQSATSIEAARVVIPFRPPIDKQLVYSVSDSGYRGEAELSLRFERSGENYALHSVMQASGMKGGRLMATLLAQPVVLNVNAEGKITGVVDEAAYWKRVTTGIERMDLTAADHERASKLLDFIRAKPADLRLALISEYQQLVLQGSGTHLALSRPSKSASFGMSQTVIVNQSTATVLNQGEAGPEAMQNLFTTILSLGAPYDGPKKVEASLRTMTRRVIDRDTGLTTAYEHVVDRKLAGRPSSIRTKLFLKAAR